MRLGSRHSNDRVKFFPTHGCVERDRTHGGNRPADGPGNPDAGRAERRAGENFCQRHAKHQIGERGDHELLHKTRAAQHTVRDELGRHNEVERRDDAQERNARVHRLPRGAVEENMHERLPGEHIQRHQRHTQRPDELDAHLETRFDTVKLRRAQILRRVVGNAVAERGEGRDDHIVELHRRGVARHDRRAEAVDDALDDDVADGNEALLQNARDGNDREPTKMVPRENAHLAFGRELHEAAEDDHKRQHAAHALTQKRCPCHARHAHRLSVHPL